MHENLPTGLVATHPMTRTTPHPSRENAQEALNRCGFRVSSVSCTHHHPSHHARYVMSWEMTRVLQFTLVRECPDQHGAMAGKNRHTVVVFHGHGWHSAHFLLMRYLLGNVAKNKLMFDLVLIGDLEPDGLTNVNLNISGNKARAFGRY